MRLISVNFQHYKSLTDVSLNDLGSLTVLVGPNASGKSNVADALRFLRDMTDGGLDHAFSIRNGITLVRQQSKTRPYKIQIAVVMRDDDDNEYRYELAIASRQGGNFLVEMERISWHDLEMHFEEDGSGEKQWVEESARYQAHRNADGVIVLDGKSMPRKLPGDVAALGTAIDWRNIGAPIARFFSSLRFSSIYPNTLKLPAKPDTDHVLKESGENWASVLKAMKRTNAGRASFAQVLEMMQRVLPTLEDVSVKTVGGYLVPQFRFTGEGGTHDFDPAQLSDGTLRIFGILLALYQFPPPPFLIIEEPEQTVHPAVLSMLAEAFREAAERTQIVVTSHSPHLIDCFSPEEIRVVTMTESGTQVAPIKRSQVKAVKQSLISLEELMAAEGLLPESA
jgi:predicted ATPase